MRYRPKTAILRDGLERIAFAPMIPNATMDACAEIAAETLKRADAALACCELWNERYGCPHETCGGCYLDKEHDERHCRHGCTCSFEDCAICAPGVLR